MKLVVISHKECWKDPNSSSGYATIGGFPYQMKALSELFDATLLLVPIYQVSAPSGAVPLIGHNLSICPLDMPAGSDLKRKINLIPWLFPNLFTIWRAIKNFDVVHCPVPGDIGTIGILLSLVSQKPLFVRHCGTWGLRATFADRFLHWLLPRIAGGRNVIMATGGDVVPPSNNPSISWIFASTITESELDAIAEKKTWKFGQSLKLVSASRLEPDKNTELIIKALPELRKHYPNISLNIIGNGSCMGPLKDLVRELQIAELVDFYGTLTHKGVMNILQASDIFVLPTRREGFPKVILEAFACGLPVIATSVSVIPQLVGDDKGIIIYDSTPEAIVEAVLRMISDENRFAQMSLRAREASRSYTLEKWQNIIGNRLKGAWYKISSESESSKPNF